MKKLAILSLFFGLALALAGCGGGGSVTGHNAHMTVHLRRTDSTQNLINYEMYFTRNGKTSFDIADMSSFASTSNRPNWIDDYSVSRSNTELTLTFTTRSNQPPYFMWVKVPSTPSAYETLELQIDVDGETGKQIRPDLAINSTQRLTNVRIDRSSVNY
ncbi:hypothetical protein BH11ARM1_BH11ARM1_07740 [soil metagenome]